MTDLLSQLDPVDWRRDRYGRPLVRHPDTGKQVPYTRPTTLAKALSDMDGLMKWSNRMTALGLAQRQDLLLRVAAAGGDDKRELDRLCEQAKEAAASSSGANLGTALHKLTERIDLGEDVRAPKPFDLDLEAYEMALGNAGVKIVPGMVEISLVCDEVQAAGTADRLVAINGNHYVADLKTGGFLAWQEYALQLAIYAHSVPYDLTADERRDWPHPPSQDKALIIHLPAGSGRCDLYWLDIARGWRAVKAALWVREWRKTKDLAEQVA